MKYKIDANKKITIHKYLLIWLAFILFLFLIYYSEASAMTMDKEDIRDDERTSTRVTHTSTTITTSTTGIKPSPGKEEDMTNSGIQGNPDSQQPRRFKVPNEEVLILLRSLRNANNLGDQGQRSETLKMLALLQISEEGLQDKGRALQAAFDLLKEAANSGNNEVKTLLQELSLQESLLSSINANNIPTENTSKTSSGKEKAEELLNGPNKKTRESEESNPHNKKRNIPNEEMLKFDLALRKAEIEKDTIQEGIIRTELAKFQLSGEGHSDPTLAQKEACEHLEKAFKLGNEEAGTWLKLIQPNHPIFKNTYTFKDQYSNHEKSSSKALQAILINIDPNKPNYNNLETVTRMKFGEGQDANYFSDYTGIDAMFETRDRNTKIFAWAAIVSFRPKESQASKFFTQKSRIEIKYLTHKSYFDTERKYGKFHKEEQQSQPDKPDPDLIPRSDRDPCKIFKEDPRLNYGFYKNWLYRNSFYEWAIENIYTLSDFIELVKSINKNKEMDSPPDYRLYGYSPNGGSLNCITFCSVLLEKAGVDLCQASKHIASYIHDDCFQKSTWWGASTSGARGVRTTAAVGFGVQSGASIGAPGGPVTMVVGGVVGGVVFGGASYLESTGIKKVLDVQAGLRNAAKPQRFIREIFDNRKNFKNAKLSIIIVKEPGTNFEIKKRFISQYNDGLGWFTTKLTGDIIKSLEKTEPELFTYYNFSQ